MSCVTSKDGPPGLFQEQPHRCSGAPCSADDESQRRNSGDVGIHVDLPEAGCGRIVEHEPHGYPARVSMKPVATPVILPRRFHSGALVRMPAANPSQTARGATAPNRAATGPRSG